MDCIAAVIGQNCNKNRLLARKFESKLVGCFSHRFNFVVKDVLDSHLNIIEKIYKINFKLRSPIAVAKIQKHTNLKPKIANKTRWISAYNMIHRHRELWNF